MSEKNYHVIELRAENILNLKAIRMRLDGKSAVITGDNEAGKSNVLNAIFMALIGDKYKPEQPIRKGEDRGEIVVDLGDIIAKKVYTQKGVRLEVENKDGAAYKSPQALLNNIIGRMSFNPIEFAELSKTPAGRKEQRQILAEMLDLDFFEIDEKLEALREVRSLKNKERKDNDTLLGKMDPPNEELPEEELSIGAELEKIEELEARRQAYLRAVRSEERRAESIEAKESEIARLELALSEARAELTNLIDEKITIPEEVSEDMIREAKEGLSDIERINRSIREARRYKEVLAARDHTAEEVDKLDRDIERLREMKDKAISEATFPVEGLSFDEENVLFNGIPFSQQSTARQYMLATAICMELNPKLKVIMLRDASVISTKNLEAICKMAEDKGYQVLIEKVDDTGKVGFYIEAGELKAINGEEVQSDEEGSGEPVAEGV